MAQKTFIDYKDIVKSFPLAEKNVGLFKPGRYSGFDTMSSVSGLVIRIGHSNTVKKTLANGDQIVSFGSFMTPTGTVIHEDETIDLTINNNTGNANTRYDWIIATHIYNEIQGGTAAVYSVIQGPNDGNPPVLSDDSIEVLLTVVEIEPEGTQYSHLTLTPVFAPLLGANSLQELYDVLKILINAGLPIASTTVQGIIELATIAEVITGTDTVRAVTPAGLAAVVSQATETVKGIVELATIAEGITGTDTVRAITPAVMQAFFDNALLDKAIVLLEGKTIQAFDIDSGASGNLSNIGFTSVYRENAGGNTDIVTFNFSALPDLNYYPIVSYYNEGDIQQNNELSHAIISNKTLTSFQWSCRENAGDTQTVLLLVTILKHV